MTNETFPAQVRSALLVGVLAGRERLSITEQRRFRALAWQVCPCACGSGPDGEGHTAWCLNGYGSDTPEPLPPELLKRLAAGIPKYKTPADQPFVTTRQELWEKVITRSKPQWIDNPEGGRTYVLSLDALFDDFRKFTDSKAESDTNERTDMPDYPHPDGDTTVLGPEIFAAHDESVICWKGQNYVPQETPDVPEATDDA